MATFSVTAAANWTDAAFATRAGVDTYNFSVGAVLTINSDTRYGPNCATTTGVVGPINWTTAGPSTLLIDGKSVRLIPFSAGSGTVPAAGSTISQGAVSAELLGVWSAINTAPTAAGAAMPSSGFLKVRNKAGGNFSAGALTGITATAKRSDIPGWIEVAMTTTVNYTVAYAGFLTVDGMSLNPFDADGNEIVVSGVRGQQIQLPASIGNTFRSFVEIEKTPGAGDWTIWPNAWPIQNASFATDERAKQVWIDGNGLLTIGHDGANAVGWMPPTGARIRFPNVLVVHSNTTVGLGSNTDAVTAGGTFAGGTFDLRNVQFNAYINHSNNPAISMDGVGVIRRGRVVSPLFPASIKRVCMVPCATTDHADQNKLAFILAPENGVVEDVVGCRATNDTSFTSALQVYLAGTNGIARRIRGQAFSNSVVSATSSSNGLSLILRNGSVAEDVEVVGGSAIECVDSVLRRLRFASMAYGTVTATPTKTFMGPNTTAWGASDISDVRWMIDTPNTCHPNATAQMLIGPNSRGLIVRDIGSRAAPLPRGTISPMGVIAAGASSQFSEGFKLSNVWLSDTGAAISEYNITSAIKNYIVEGGQTLAVAVRGSANGGVVRGVRTNNVVLTQSGGVVGVHWGDVFLSDTTGALCVLLNGTTADTVEQAVIVSGSPVLGNGALVMPNIGDSVEFTMAYFAQGHTALSGVTISGTASQYSFEFAADTGSGFGALQSASPANLAAVVIDPAKGVRVKLRVTKLVANNVSVNNLRVDTVSTLAAQDAIYYPLRTVTLTVNGLVTGSRVKITRQDTGALLLNAAESSGQVTLTTDYTGMVVIEARKASATPYYQPWTAVASLSNGNTTVTALQIRDDQ